MFKPPGECPVCGKEVHRGAKACPECGADDKSGWKEDELYDGLNLPDNDFDYEDFTKNEFGSPKSKGIKPLWWFVAVILLILSVLFLFIR
jgi:hypothetical protein